MSEAPAGPWLRTWVLTVLLVVLLLGALEGYARLSGFRPCLDDSAGLWAYNRMKITPYDQRACVILGSSKAQLGINLDAFMEVTGTKPAQLSIDGTSAHAFLDYFADDDSFVGLAIVEARLLFDGRERHDLRTREMIDHYEFFRASVSARFDFRMRLLYASSMASASPELSARAVLEALWNLRPPRRSYVTMNADRARFADYQAIDFERQRALAALQFGGRRERLTGEAWEARYRQLAEAVARIEARGGRVVFLYMPCPPRLDDHDEAAPQAWQDWETFTSRTPAICINVLDYPLLAQFPCPDNTHLDYRDAGPFTRALVSVLRDELAKRSDTRLE